MKTESAHTATITLSEIIAHLLPVLEEHFDCTADPNDIDVVYDPESRTFTLKFETEGEVALSDGDETETDGLMFEAEIERGDRVSEDALNLATGGRRYYWPKVGQAIKLVDRDGLVSYRTAARIDSDGEIFVEDDPHGPYITVSNREDDDDGYCVPRIAKVRWSIDQD